MHLTALAQARSGYAKYVAGALPVAAEEFAAALAALEPFESDPHLAVAVSGGRDSLALTLMAQQWTQVRGGRLTALIVDHRLRSESTDEAQGVAKALRARNIPTEILSWTGEKPATGVSEAARDARYALLQARCRELGILHLLLGHQADDQAETILLRLADGSGPEGLAGMSPVVEMEGLRVLRPLLGFSRARLAATVIARGLTWIDDPSNEREISARIRARKALSEATKCVLNEVGDNAAALRREIDRRLAALLIDLVCADARGFAWLDRAGFAALPPMWARRILSRLAATYGGRHYPARHAGLLKAEAVLRAGRNAVAGGCLFAPRGGRILVCREAGSIGDTVAVKAQQALHWDKRYRLVAAQDGAVGPLGSTGRQRAKQEIPEILGQLPAPVGAALPGLWQNERLAAVFVPNLALARAGSGDRRVAALPATLISCSEAVFQPSRGLALPAWPLVLPRSEPIYLD